MRIRIDKKPNKQVKTKYSFIAERGKKQKESLSSLQRLGRL